MYVRTVAGKELNFQVSGKLWNRSLIMSDKETKSLWSHLLGEAMEGELLGAKLTTLPSVITSWEKWKTAHPSTKVMILPGRLKGQEYDKTFYQTHQKKPFVIGYVDGSTARHYPFKVVRKQPLINDIVAERPILITFDNSTGAAMCFNRTVGENVLTFAIKDNKVLDNETDSIWDLNSGKAVFGKLTGSRLKPLVVIPSYEFAWEKFHPESEAYAIPE